MTSNQAEFENKQLDINSLPRFTEVEFYPFDPRYLIKLNIRTGIGALIVLGALIVGYFLMKEYKILIMINMISNMKREIIVVAIMMFGLVNTANATMTIPQQEKDLITADFKSEPAFLQNYIKIKNALVNDDYEQVKQTALKMQKSLDEVELNKEQHNELNNVVSNLAKAGDIKAQRKEFVLLSQHLYQLVQRANLSDKPLYVQHCPMAMGGQGAIWISQEEQVRNPYMGQRMPGCGSLQEKTEIKK